MLAHFFRPRHKPRDTREMIRVLRAAAQFSDDSTQRIEYDQAADALDRVLTAAARHSDAPTRDAFSYALGRAELDLGDKLTELIEVSKDTHIVVQDVQKAQQSAHPQITEALAGIAALKKAWGDLDEWRARVEATIVGFMASRDVSLAERAELKQVVAQIDARLLVVEEILELVPKSKADS